MESQKQTDIVITVDTELSAALYQAGVGPAANLVSSILGRCAHGAYGIVHQMERLDAYGQKAVFFVDPMPALVYGTDIVADMVGPIIERGHEVQLHVHTEWLEWAKESPVGGRQGRNLADFCYEDQLALLTLGRDWLVEAGAPEPVAFRAGNYGANDDSLRALHALGLIWDSSFNPGSDINDCRISLPSEQSLPVYREDIVELPVAAIFDRPGNIRPAQICALSSTEMQAAIDHAHAQQHPAFVIVTHSFELLSRDRKRVNRTIARRFERLVQYIHDHPGVRTTGFRSLNPDRMVKRCDPLPRLEADSWRTRRRIGEQIWAQLRYE